MEIIYTTHMLFIMFIINAILSIFIKKQTTLYCGLIGFSGSDPSQRADVGKLGLLLVWNSLERGTDSVGIYSPEHQIYKSTDLPYNVYNTNGFQKHIQDSSSLLIHVRKTSIGVNSIRNAHPFKFNNIVGAHNGTLKDYDSLARKYNIPFSSYQVDSEVILNALSMNIRDNNLKVLTEFKGAATLLMYDELYNVFYVYKGPDRPLFYAYDDNNNMYISSLKEPLDFNNFNAANSFEDNHFYVIKDSVIIHTVKLASNSPTKTLSTKICYNLYGLDNNAFKENTITGVSEHFAGVLLNTFPKTVFDGYHIQLKKIPEYLSRNKRVNLYDRYLILGYNDFTKKFIISLGKKEVAHISIEYLDLTDFIPSVGRCGYILRNLFVNGKDLVLRNGEVVKVVDHRFPEEKIEVETEKGNRYTIVDRSDFYLFTIDEEKLFEMDTYDPVNNVEFNMDEILNLEQNV